MCYDIFCLIIKGIEKKNLGMIFKSTVSKESKQCVSVLFVDDTDLITEGENAESKMQEIINIYKSLHAATGGKIEGEKTKFYT